MQTIVEKNCVQVFNADQTAVFFEYVPTRTITDKGTKTVWIRCGNKDKERATAMLLGDWDGNKYDTFILFKSTPAKKTEKQQENNKFRNGFGTRVWREIKGLQDKFPCKIYGNKSAWWNEKLSVKFLEYHFANRENRLENILLLWDDCSAHWTKPVLDYAASINVVLLKVPPKYTYVCQPADISWNKPFKSQLRALWIESIRQQLRSYNDGECDRLSRKEQIEAQINVARTELDQAKSAKTVAGLRKKLDEEKFSLVAPSRSVITDWITSCWSNLSAKTIVSGFARAGLLTDVREVSSDEDSVHDINSVVAELARYKITEEEINSEDDIGSECSESEDDSDNDDT